MNIEDLDSQAKDIEELIGLVYHLTGYDFRQYARRSLYRRIARYLDDVKLSSAAALQVKVQHDSETLNGLLSALTIDFTSMFRDPGFFDSIRGQVIPLLRRLPFIRIWHAGCASGEEVYSMAILLAENGLYEKARLYATDMNALALARARRGIFPISRMKEFTRNYLASGGQQPFSNYYTAVYNHAILNSALQKNIVWAQHNLTCDNRFIDFDLIVCRNVLIYFNQDLKDRVHAIFYNSLNPGGILALGSHETIRFSPFESGYTPLDETAKIYLKTSAAPNVR